MPPKKSPPRPQDEGVKVTEPAEQIQVIDLASFQIQSPLEELLQFCFGSKDDYTNSRLSPQKCKYDSIALSREEINESYEQNPYLEKIHTPA